MPAFPVRDGIKLHVRMRLEKAAVFVHALREPFVVTSDEQHRHALRLLPERVVELRLEVRPAALQRHRALDARRHRGRAEIRPVGPRGVSDGNDLRFLRKLVVSARLRKLREKCVERGNFSFRELLVKAHEPGCDEDDRGVCGCERAAKVGVREKRLLEHVVVSDHDGLHALRRRRNPEIRPRRLFRLLVDETIDFDSPLVDAPD